MHHAAGLPAVRSEGLAGTKPPAFRGHDASGMVRMGMGKPLAAAQPETQLP